MPTDLILAKLSHYAYEPLLANLPKGWKYHTDSDKLGYYHTGYFGICVINDITTEMVIASRGTNGIIGDISSDLEIGRAIMPAQFTDAAWPFTNEVMQGFRAEKQVKYFFTGHSLGAVLAELSQAQALEQGIKSRTVTFDSPGSFEIISKYMPDIAPARLAETITIYNGPHNHINSANQHAGKTYKVEIDSFQASYHNYFSHPELNTLVNVGINIITQTVHNHKLEYLIKGIEQGSVTLVNNWHQDNRVAPAGLSLGGLVKSLDTTEIGHKALNMFSELIGEVANFTSELELLG